MLKILLCGLLLALPVLAEEAEDRQTATSLHYVSHELDTRQNKLSTGTNAAITYTNTAGNVTQRTVKSDLTGGTTDTSLPQVNAVNAGLNTKQDDISAINDHTAVTYTGQTGTIGAKGIYQDTGTYAEQSDNLIDAKTFNAALKNGLDSEFICTEYKPGTDLCWLWQIHNVTNVQGKNLFDGQWKPGIYNLVSGAYDSTAVNRICNKNIIKIEPSTQYTASFPGFSGAFRWLFYKADRTFLSSINTGATTITSPENAAYMNFYFGNDLTVATAPDTQIEKGDVATPYQPYQEMPYTTLVPDGYTPVEYIESTGTQFINTGRALDGSDTVEFKYSHVTPNSQHPDNMLVGDYGGDTSFALNLMNAGPYYRLYFYYKSPVGVPIMAINDFDEPHIIRVSDGTLFVDDVFKYRTDKTNDFTTAHNAQVFRASGFISAMRVYYYRVVDHSGNILQNLVPARRNNDNVLGMYDTVGGNFLTNAGTGTFTAGPEINNIIYLPQGQ